MRPARTTVSIMLGTRALAAAAALLFMVELDYADHTDTGTGAPASTNWLSETPIVDRHHWFEIFETLETTRFDSFAVTNVSLPEAMRRASDMYEAAHGRPLGCIFRWHQEPAPISLNLTNVCAVDVYQAIAEAGGFKWYVDRYAIILLRAADYPLAIWRARVTDEDRRVFASLPPRFVESGAMQQMAFLRSSGMLLFRDKQDAAESVMVSLYDLGLIRDLEVHDTTIDSGDYQKAEK